MPQTYKIIVSMRVFQIFIYVGFLSVENGEMYMETLAKHCKQTKQGLKFDTISAKRDNEMGYVSSIKLKNVVYGSEGMFQLHLQNI